MSKFKNYLLVSDIDGTLVNSKGILSIENISSIKYFIDNGGLFTLATGRSVDSAEKYVKQLPITIPTININGACIYDYKSKKYLYEAFLPDDYKVIVNKVSNIFPNIGIISFSNTGAYSFYDNEATKILQKVEKIGYTIFDNKFNENPYKILFICKNGEKEQLEKFLITNFNYNIDYVATSDIYFEMIPKSISKGKALLKLLRIININLKNTIAIGDYFNDIEMINISGIGVAVKNAHPIVKDKANLIVESCDNNAIKNLIDYLDKNI